MCVLHRYSPHTYAHVLQTHTMHMLLTHIHACSLHMHYTCARHVCTLHTETHAPHAQVYTPDTCSQRAHSQVIRCAHSPLPHTCSSSLSSEHMPCFLAAGLNRNLDEAAAAPAGAFRPHPCSRPVSQPHLCWKELTTEAQESRKPCG